MSDKMLRWGRLVAVLAALALVAAACGDDEAPSGGDETGSTGPTGTTAAEPFRVALVAPSATNDLAFTQSMFDALNVLKESENLEIAVSDNLFVVDDAASAISNYASQGFDLVIAHGSQFGGSVEQIALEFPDVSFAWGTAGDTFGQPNVYAYQAASDQGGYVQGVLAAGLTQSKVIGVVGPIEVGDAKLYVDGFKAGVEATDPSIDVRVNYTGSFSDVGLASEAARSFVAADADVMTGTAQMVVGAIGVATESDVAWFGTQADQTSLGPSVVVASQVYHWEIVLQEIIDGVRAGTLGGESYTIDLANGGEVIEYNPDYGLAADVQAAGDAAVEGIKDGSITTGVTE
jgi:basic membrane lipoprotein Med (substrate-binding protein (PBP1-ABC) superfamily)